MLLSDWIHIKRIRLSDFAAMIEKAGDNRLSCSNQAVSQWVAGSVMPTTRYMSAILFITDGTVTPNDCYQACAEAQHSDQNKLFKFDTEIKRVEPSHEIVELKEHA